MKTTENKQVIALRSLQNSFPSEVDYEIHRTIKNYISVKGKTYSTLARDIDEYVRRQYKDIWNLVEEGKLTQARLEKHIKEHTPSRSYLYDYANGRSICFRYTNTIANFFEVDYSITNFNPSEDLDKSLELNS